MHHIYYFASLLFMIASVMGFLNQVHFSKVQILRIRRGSKIDFKASTFDPASVRAISLDVTGTLLVHPTPIMQTYAEAAVWARLPNPPSSEELKPGGIRHKVCYLGCN